MVVPVVDDSNTPFLVPGDWVAVDPQIREMEFGGLYCIYDALRSQRIYEVRKPSAMWEKVRGKPAVILAPLNKAVWDEPRHRPGPAIVEWCMDNMVGKVVGLYEPSLVAAAILASV